MGRLVNLQRSKAVCLFALFLIAGSLPGCLNDEEKVGSEFCGAGTMWDSVAEQCVVDSNPFSLYQGNRSYVTMDIVHSDSIANATLTYTIEIELYHDEAPIHADNMRRLVQSGMYNNTTFHRIIDNFMIQGGDFENNDGTGGYAAQWYGYCDGQYMSNSADCNSETLYTLPDEAGNGLRHLPCMISMAKTSQPNTGSSQFFIMPDDITEHDWLNGVHTVFGKVISGCEHITALSEVATGANDRPVVPVIIASAAVIENSE